MNPFLILMLTLTIPSVINLFLIAIIIRPKWWRCILIWMLITGSKFFLSAFIITIFLTPPLEEAPALLVDFFLYFFTIFSFGVVEFLFLYLSLEASWKKALVVSLLTQASIVISYLKYLSERGF